MKTIYWSQLTFDHVNDFDFISENSEYINWFTVITNTKLSCELIDSIHDPKKVDCFVYSDFNLIKDHLQNLYIKYVKSNLIHTYDADMFFNYLINPPKEIIDFYELLKL
jgi:hypothetical protein